MPCAQAPNTVVTNSGVPTSAVHQSRSRRPEPSQWRPREAPRRHESWVCAASRARAVRPAHRQQQRDVVHRRVVRRDGGRGPGRGGLDVLEPDRRRRSLRRRHDLLRVLARDDRARLRDPRDLRKLPGQQRGRARHADGPQLERPEDRSQPLGLPVGEHHDAVSRLGTLLMQRRRPAGREVSEVHEREPLDHVGLVDEREGASRDLGRPPLDELARHVRVARLAAPPWSSPELHARSLRASSCGPQSTTRD